MKRSSAFVIMIYIYIRVAPCVATIQVNVGISMFCAKVAGSNPAWRAKILNTVLNVDISALDGVFLCLAVYE